MSDEKIKEVFSTNLRKYLEANDKQPVDIVNDLGIPFSTVSNWVNGTKLPRMGKVEMLAQYFGIQKSDLLEEKQDDNYYLNDETREIAQFAYENPEARILFNALRTASPENLKLVTDLVNKLS